MKKAAIFVDVQNIYYTTRQAYQTSFNYRTLWQNLSYQFDIEYAYAYAIDKGDSKQMGFQRALREIGFDVKLKPMIQRSDGSAKGDWDVGIAIDVMDYASKVDAIILLSGDGDFTMLLDRVRDRFNVETHVYGVKALTADSIINSDAIFHPIESNLLQKKG